jgi:class 3 adenylate cyclase
MTRSRGIVLATLVLALLVALPIAVWLDLRDLTQGMLRQQASDLNSAITSIRGYYANHVVGRVLEANGSTHVLPNYADVPGAIPIPATLSLELARVIGEKQANISYRFVSDYPFKNRAAHALDAFETKALTSLRHNPKREPIRVTSSLYKDSVREITPIIMEPACVSCHNSHPDSPKRDWKVGDVRGIQEVTMVQPMWPNLFSQKYLLLYLAVASASGLAFIALQWRQANAIADANRQLSAKNDFLAAISAKISPYLSPQVYQAIFSGRSEAAISTQRKKLTIFFSDIVDFTGATLRMQPEQIASLLNEYLTEMSRIALAHGGTIDKFIGDAVLVFFGDPETQGPVQDARACLQMAAAMQRRIAELNANWRQAGIDHPLRVRMGINTGFCNVGNFGSADRMDYTVIGAEVNLAERLQSIAEPGGIVLSYETYALVRDLVLARPLPPLEQEAIGAKIVPYAVEHWLDGNGKDKRVLCEHTHGLDLYFDPSVLDPEATVRVRTVLQRALSDLGGRPEGRADQTGGDRQG